MTSNKLTFKSWIGFLFRLFPVTAEPGLRVIGHPDADSPVLVTANFALTVKRVMKQLKGLDCYLLVAPTRGINVWCAAGGDSFNAHSIISVLKTSGINYRVAHRRLILPQLAAPGIDTRQVLEKAGWHCAFGPVYAKDIPAYLKTGQKTEAMKRIDFNWKERLDAGFGCSFTGYLLIMLALAVFDALTGIAWFAEFTCIGFGLLFSMYLFYPYTPGRSGWRKVLAWEVFLAILYGIYCVLPGGSPSASGTALYLTAAVTALVIGIDFGGVMADNRTDFDPFMRKLGFIQWGEILYFDNFRIRLILGIIHIRFKEEACIGCGKCEDVCPMGVYTIDGERKKSLSAAPHRCIACTACVKQCPAEALYLQQASGGV
jgi:NAD-dependent dihydropyrimidine dehydrogenase PreA subunit